MELVSFELTLRNSVLLRFPVGERLILSGNSGIESQRGINILTTSHPTIFFCQFWEGNPQLTSCKVWVWFIIMFEKELWIWWELVGLGGFGVMCSPQDPRFAGSNPTEVDGFFQDVKILSTSPPGETLSWGSRVWDFRLVKEPQAWKNRPLSKI